MDNNKDAINKDELRKFVNKIFTKKGYKPVRKFAAEFADGSKCNFVQACKNDDKLCSLFHYSTFPAAFQFNV